MTTDLNLPIGGVAALLVVFFMKLKTPEGTARQKLAKIDWMYVISIFFAFAINSNLFSEVISLSSQAQQQSPLVSPGEVFNFLGGQLKL